MMARMIRGERRLDGRRRLAIWGATAALMALPVIAIRAAARAPSDPGDFVFLAVLVLVLGLVFELAARVPDRRAYAAGSAIGVAAALLGTWINLAVGIVGSEDNPANWLFLAPFVVAFAGALVASPRPLALARAMTAAAATQMLAFAIAWAAGLGFTGPISLSLTGLWLISAWLFARAGRTAGE